MLTTVTFMTAQTDAIAARDLFRVYLQRTGADILDTLANAAAVVGLTIAEAT